MLSRTQTRLLNLALYQLGWLACVVAAAEGRPYLGAAAALILIAFHLLLAPDPAAELKLAAAAAGVGLVVDSVTVSAGLLAYTSGTLVPGLCPPWILAMWMLFAITFHYCLDWLRGRLLLASLLGLVGGPLSFWAGERLGAVAFFEPRLLTYGTLGVLWALALPLLLLLAERYRPAESAPRYRLPGRDREPALRLPPASSRGLVGVAADPEGRRR